MGRFAPSPFHAAVTDDDLDRHLARYRRAEHGTYERWLSGCECDCCTSQHSVVVRERKKWTTS